MIPLLFEALVDALPAVGGKPGVLRRRPGTPHAYKGYDFARCRAHLKRRSIQDRIARRGIERNDRLGRHRWVVTHPFLSGSLRQAAYPLRHSSGSAFPGLLRHLRPKAFAIFVSLS